MITALKQEQGDTHPCITHQKLLTMAFIKIRFI